MKLPTKLLPSLALSLLAVLTSVSHAMENARNAKPTQKWYKVEVIIFTQRDVFGEEHASRNITMGYPQNLIDLYDNTAGFNPLPDKQRELGPDAYSLNSTGVYKVLFHKAWQQPGLNPAAAPWIDIAITRGNTVINGSLRVYLSSYLHMESNIWQVNYATSMGSPISQTFNSPELAAQGLLPSPSGTSLEQAKPWPQPPISPIVLSRVSTEEQGTYLAQNLARKPIKEIMLLKQASRLKLNKVHYFDHPKMGLLFKVTRSKPPAIQ